MAGKYLRARADWHEHKRSVNLLFCCLFYRPSIGHYTQVVQQNAYQVGCGLIVWYAEHHGKNEQNSYFVCNYAVGNILGSPIYSSGATASGCTSGTDGNFIGLCAPDEPISSAELAD